MHRITIALLTACLAVLGHTAAASAATPDITPGVYTISPAHTAGTMVLDVSGAATGPAPVGQWKKYGPNGNPNQQFRLEKMPTGLSSNVYRLLPQHATGMCLDIAYAADIGGQLIQHGCNGQQNQEFFVIPAPGSSGTYMVVPRHSGLLLQVPGRSFAPGAGLDTAARIGYPDAPPDYQRFQFTKVAN